jgi:hypothetical protein
MRSITSRAKAEQRLHQKKRQMASSVRARPTFFFPGHFFYFSIAQWHHLKAIKQEAAIDDQRLHQQKRQMASSVRARSAFAVVFFSPSTFAF